MFRLFAANVRAFQALYHDAASPWWHDKSLWVRFSLPPGVA